MTREEKQQLIKEIDWLLLAGACVLITLGKSVSCLIS